MVVESAARGLFVGGIYNKPKTRDVLCLRRRERGTVVNNIKGVAALPRWGIIFPVCAYVLYTHGDEDAAGECVLSASEMLAGWEGDVYARGH